MKYASLLAAFICGIAGAGAHTPFPVTASSVHPGDYNPAYAFDGNPKTRWASKPGGAQWLQIDLGKTMPVNDVHIRWERAYAAEYRIEVSDDGKHWKSLAHKKNAAGGTDRFDSLGGSGRYLRVHCIKAGPYKLCSIWEVDLPGKEIRTVIEEAERKAAKERRAALAGVFETCGIRKIVFAAREPGVDGHWYANFAYYAPDENRVCYRAGGRLCTLNVETGKTTILVDDPKGSVRDPAVGYDGKTILFSWRKAGEKTFHLHAIKADGSNLRQLTEGIYDDIEPCWLPGGGIMFVSGRCKRWVNCWLTQVGVLYRCDADGKNIRQISANIEHDNTPWVLPDGRILYQRWEYVDRSQVHYHHLWTANPDGTGQMVYFGNMHAGNVFIDAKPIPGTEKVLMIRSPGHGRREHAGHVAIVTDRHGPDDLSAMRDVSKQGNCRDPWPLTEDAFLVAIGRDLLLMDAAGGTAKVYSLPKQFGGRCELHEPRPLVSRKRERVIPSRVDPSSATGELILIDAYFGRNMDGVEKGDIKKLLVLETLSKPINFTGGMDPISYGGTFTLERIVGTVPVEKDGSAYMKLPANRALFFVALDENDLSVKRMQSFLTVMPGEVTSCVGCHEARGTSTGAMRKDLARLDAMQRPASAPKPIEGIPDVFDFPRDIQPILEKHCVKCHRCEKRCGGVTLTGDRGPMFSLSYAALTIRKQVADGRNRPKSNYPPRALGTAASPLMKKIDGSHHDVTLSARERDMIRYWIESAAAYPGTYAALGNGAIGGYIQNRLVNRDEKWPTAAGFRQTVEKRCLECHKKLLKLPLPRSISDEIGLSFWRPDWNDKRLRFSRHLMFNLSRPEQSLLLLAPLAKKAGGLQLCKQSLKKGEDAPAVVFADTADPGYTAMRSHIAAGKDRLEEIGRFDMPHFKPPPQYIREMKRYGVLNASFDIETDPVDCYELDRQYWRSLWYRPTE